MQQVFLVRHGETQWNIERRLQGQSDSQLTDVGEWQAQRVAARLQHIGITHIITSDLNRTRRTAQIIAKKCGCGMIEDPRLRELHLGVLEQRSIEQLSDQEEQWRNSLLNGDREGRIPQGESMQELALRMRAALDDCLLLPVGSKPVLVSHGLALSCLLTTLLGLPAFSQRRLRLRNCSLSRVDYQRSDWLAEGWIVESTGDISHLEYPAQDVERAGQESE